MTNYKYRSEKKLMPTAGDEKFGGGRRACAAGDGEWRVTVAVARIDVGAGVEERTGGDDIVLADALEQQILITLAGERNGKVGVQVVILRWP